jgi:hypothetical protein
VTKHAAITHAATTIGIILGSTRPGRNGEAVANWVHDIAKQRDDAEYELVDIADYQLPHLDEAIPPSLGQYTQPHTKAWAAKIDSFDGYVFVTPGVQPLHLRRAEERHRLPLQGMEQQGRRLRQLRLRRRHPRRRTPPPRHGRTTGRRRARPGRTLVAHRLHRLRTVHAGSAPDGGRHHRPRPGRGLERRVVRAAGGGLTPRRRSSATPAQQFIPMTCQNGKVSRAVFADLHRRFGCGRCGHR